jgi:hypothetical protein
VRRASWVSVRLRFLGAGDRDVGVAFEVGADAEVA